MPVVVDPLHDLLDTLDVGGVGGADEEVLLHAYLRHQSPEALGVAVRQLARRHALALGGVRDGLAVLIRPGLEEDPLAALAHVTGEDVCRDRRVGVAEVRLGVDVVDRGCDVEAHREAGYSPLGPGPPYGFKRLKRSIV